MDWLEITVNCDPENAEAVADVLARYAPGGVAIQQNALDLTGDVGRVDQDEDLALSDGIGLLSKRLQRTHEESAALEVIGVPPFHRNRYLARRDG